MQNLESSLLLNFIKSIDSHLIEEFYSSPYTCSVIFRELSNVSRHIISRILLVNETVRKSLIASFVNKDFSHVLTSCLEELNDLKILTTVINEQQCEHMRLNMKFQMNLRYALFGGQMCYTVTEHRDPSVKAISSDILTERANSKWESVLTLVAGINISNFSRNSIVRSVITNAGYIKNEEMTSKGFQFLLLQKKKQVWEFLVAYLKYLKNPSIIIDIMPLLCQIGGGAIDQVYTCTELSDSQQTMMKHLLEFGFIYSRIKPPHLAFQVTKLLTNLLSGNDRMSLRDNSDQSTFNSQGYIIIQPDDLVYASTDSELKTAVLKMFCNLEKIFPHGAVFHITDQSIYRALDKGITSDEIISFLRNNAHSENKNKPIVPIAVVDKIKLAEYNRNRARPTSGYIYHSFANLTEFDTLVGFAESKNAVAWKNREKLMVMVYEDSHSLIHAFWKNRKKSNYIQ